MTAGREVRESQKPHARLRRMGHPFPESEEGFLSGERFGMTVGGEVRGESKAPRGMAAFAWAEARGDEPKKGRTNTQCHTGRVVNPLPYGRTARVPRGGALQL